MRLGNPAVRRALNNVENGVYSAEESKASYKGVYAKAALYAAVTVVAALATYAIILSANIEAIFTLLIVAGIAVIPILIIALVMAFIPSTVKVLGFVYAIIQGGLLGIMSAFLDLLIMPCLALSALLGTLLVFGVSVFANSVLKVRISNGFVRGVLIVFVCLAAVQLIMFLLSLIGVFSYVAYIWLQLAVSAICIIWATIMLAWDLNNIDAIVLGGADKKYEWYVAFSLVSTLIYLYVEILELIARLALLFMQHKN